MQFCVITLLGLFRFVVTGGTIQLIDLTKMPQRQGRSSVRCICVEVCVHLQQACTPNCTIPNTTGPQSQSAAKASKVQPPTCAAFSLKASAYARWCRPSTSVLKLVVPLLCMLCATSHNGLEICPMLPNGMGTLMRAATDGAKAI